MFLNLSKPEHSYFLGFVHADGNFQQSTRNRGKLTIELDKRDLCILETFQNMFSSIHPTLRFRDRVTNFGESHSAILSFYDFGFRKELNKYVPYGKKSAIVSVPNGVVLCDYFRGYIDGNGSLGLTSRGIPFISMTVVSENLKISYLDYVYSLTGRMRQISRNKRDNVYNIMISNDDSLVLIRSLYYPNCLCLPRKYEKALQALSWVRALPKKTFASRHRWTKEEDFFLFFHSPQETVDKFPCLSLSGAIKRKSVLKKSIVNLRPYNNIQSVFLQDVFAGRIVV